MFMSFRSSIVLIATLSVLGALAGCGSSNSTGNSTITGSTSTNSELNGTYTYSVSGADATGAFFAMTGSFTADGGGKVTGGTTDYNDPESGIQGFDLAITGGSYAVGSDGRGTATLNVNSLGSIGFDFALSSTSHGLVTRFDKGGTGSGTLDLQTSATQAQFAGSYAFSFNGIDGNSSPASAVGAFTLDASGNVTTGIQDVNDALSVAAGQALTGTVTIGSGTAPGTATINGPFGAQTFDVYVVDQTHLKFVEADSVALLAGDVFSQPSASIPTGAVVFTIGGLNASEDSLAAGGFFTFNSDGTISGGSEDINNSGGSLLSQVGFTGTYTTTGARTVLNLSAFTPAIQFAVYPSSGGILMLETDTLAITSGVALAQTASVTSFSTTGGYGLNLSAYNLGSAIEVDDIAAFTATSTSITGTLDENDGGISLKPGQTLSGTYAASGGGRGTLSLQSGALNFDYYVASSSSVLLIETDVGQVGSGSFLGQSGVGPSIAHPVHAAMVRARNGFRPSLKSRVGNK
jgi:hypothetical protein